MIKQASTLVDLTNLSQKVKVSPQRVLNFSIFYLCWEIQNNLIYSTIAPHKHKSVENRISNFGSGKVPEPKALNVQNDNMLKVVSN